jgi:hypothetical protein
MKIIALLFCLIGAAIANAAYESVGKYAPLVTNTPPSSWGSFAVGMPVNVTTLAKIQALYDMILERLDVPSGDFEAGGDKRGWGIDIAPLADREILPNTSKLSRDAVERVHNVVRRFLATPRSPSAPPAESGVLFPQQYFPLSAKPIYCPTKVSVVAIYGADAFVNSVRWAEYLDASQVVDSTRYYSQSLTSAFDNILGYWGEDAWIDVWEPISEHDFIPNYKTDIVGNLWPMTHTILAEPLMCANAILKSYKYQPFIFTTPIPFEYKGEEERASYRYHYNIEEIRAAILHNAVKDVAFEEAFTLETSGHAISKTTDIFATDTIEAGITIQRVPRAGSAYGLVKSQITWENTPWVPVRRYTVRVKGGKAIITESKRLVMPSTLEITDISAHIPSEPIWEVNETIRRINDATVLASVKTASKQLRDYAPHYLAGGKLSCFTVGDVVSYSGFEGYTSQRTQDIAAAAEANISGGDASTAAEDAIRNLGNKLKSYITGHESWDEPIFKHAPSVLRVGIWPVTRESLMAQSYPQFKHHVRYEMDDGTVKESDEFFALPADDGAGGDGAGGDGTSDYNLNDRVAGDDGELGPPPDAEKLNDEPSSGSGNYKAGTRVRVTFEFLDEAPTSYQKTTVKNPAFFGQNEFNFTSF